LLIDIPTSAALLRAQHDNKLVCLINSSWCITGKTSTVAELIQQAVHKFKYKVLVTAPSNVAVDNVLERIVQSQAQQPRKKKNSSAPTNKCIRAVRLGHPARIKSSILPYSLEAQVQGADGTEIVADVRRELNSFLQVLLNPRSRGADKRVAYREVKALRKEVRERETKVVQQLIKDAQVVLATTVGAANRILNDVEFDLVIIDEAAQALEASCWIPILRGRRLVLAGDHCQLPPTIKSNDPTVQKGLSKTLFERIMELYGQKSNHVSRMLKVQYRMHEVIANWASSAMYNGELQTHESVRHRRLSGLSDVSGDQPALLLIDTAGCAMEESVNTAGSRFNEGEAQLVVQHVKTLLSLGMKAEEIAVISPYNGQVEVLRTLLLPDVPKLEIRSVDGFQGGEREAVVLSLVRSNTKGVIGFLKDQRRLNVAVTRAKRHCAIICDADTVSQNDFISGLVEWMEEHGEYHSAMEFQGTDLQGDLELAEAELLKLTTPVEATRKRGDKDIQEKRPPRGKNEPTKRNDTIDKLLQNKITSFLESGSPGEELALNSDLSKNDRRLVHEQATEMGLNHHSEGVDGVDRRIILSIPKMDTACKDAEELAVETSAADTDGEGDDEDDDGGGAQASRPTAFATLNDDESDDESESNEDTTSTETLESTTKPPPTVNQMLGNLALERRHREQSVEASVPATRQPSAPSGGKKKKKKGGQKLGGNKVAKPKDDPPDDDLDEMAFLDAQINEVQNSHGRKVEGTGGYRTLINGILISKPQAKATKKDPRALSALNTKLKEAQLGRKAKGKKKK
jgi:ATP-dependent RNA/DNA helicase IGHMBP2